MAEKTKDQDQTPPTQKEEAAAPKTVRVKVLKPFLNNRTRLIEAKIGATVEVLVEDVAELTKDFGGGSYAFRGERFAGDGDVKRHNSRRAELVAA